MSYSKELELKIMRCKHKIVFKMGTSITDLEAYLSNIPENSVVDECYEKDNEYVLIFHEEKVLE